MFTEELFKVTAGTAVHVATGHISGHLHAALIHKHTSMSWNLRLFRHTFTNTLICRYMSFLGMPYIIMFIICLAINTILEYNIWNHLRFLPVCPQVFNTQQLHVHQWIDKSERPWNMKNMFMDILLLTTDMSKGCVIPIGILIRICLELWNNSSHQSVFCYCEVAKLTMDYTWGQFYSVYLFTLWEICTIKRHVAVATSSSCLHCNYKCTHISHRYYNGSTFTHY